MEKEFQEYVLGDMLVRYDRTPQGAVGLTIVPATVPIPKDISRQAATDSMVQLKIEGDVYNGAYAPGNTLRNGESVERLCYENQEKKEEDGVTTITTRLRDDRGLLVIHVLTHDKEEKVLRVHCEFVNESSKAVTLEMMESVSIQNISPYLSGDGSGEILVHRLQSRWSEEGRLLSQTLEELQLEPGWNQDSVRCERFGQVGSLPVNRYFPFLAVEDKKNHIFWGMQLAHNASWQMELYRLDDNLAISAGLADMEFGHWKKRVEPGQRFVTPYAILTAAQSESLDVFTRRLVDAGKKAVDAGPAQEQELPIVFNEYCTTWGNPSHENICAILDKIKEKGFTYFVIDCGWYKTKGVPWDISMGDYQVSQELFPQGMEKTVEAIREAGLKPGIWFEIENVGKAARAYLETEHLLKRDGVPLTTTRRRFWDMKDPWVWEYLQERVIGTLKKYGFSYMKMDYNDTVGLGCDGFESLGEGLRQNMEAARRFVEQVKTEIPGIVLENCASGGHRLEPGYMALTSMASFSDAHECPEIPVTAANLHRVILPRQSQIWAVIRQEDSLKRIAYSVAATFLGRMCISGDVWKLNEEQWHVLDEGIAFYKKIVPVIKEGQSYRLGPEIKTIRHPRGWQAVVRVGDDGNAFVVIHTFHGEVPEEIGFALPDGCPQKIGAVYSDMERKVQISRGRLCLKGCRKDAALALYLCRENS